MAQESVQSRKRGRVTGPGVGAELARASEGPAASAMVPQLDEWPGLDAQLSLERQLSTPWGLTQQLRQLQTEHQQRQQQRATPSAAFPFSLTVEQQVPDVAFSPRFQPPFDGRGTAATLRSFRHSGPTGPYPAYPCARDDLPQVPSSSSAAISTFQLYQANNNSAREIPRSSIAEQFEAIAKEHRSLSRVSSRLSTVSSSVTLEDGSFRSSKRSRNTFEHLPSTPAAVVLPTVPELTKAAGPSMTGKLFQSFFAREAPLAEPELSSATEGPSVPSLGRELRDHKVPMGIGSVPSVPRDVNEASSPPLASASRHVRNTPDGGDRRQKMPAARWPTLFGVKLVPASNASGKDLCCP